MSAGLIKPRVLTVEQQAARDKLDASIKRSVAEVEQMTPRQFEVMKRQQAKSWARQTMD